MFFAQCYIVRLAKNNLPIKLLILRFLRSLGLFAKHDLVCYSPLIGGWNLVPIFCVIFDKNGSSSLEYVYKKPCRTCPTTVKSLKKHQNAPTITYKKSQISLLRFLHGYT